MKFLLAILITLLVFLCFFMWCCLKVASISEKFYENIVSKNDD